MTSVLVEFFAALPEASHRRPWSGPGRGIVDGDFVANLVRTNSREAFHKVSILGRPHKVGLWREVCGVDDHSVAFPSADRVPGPGANGIGKMWTPIQRDDPRLVHHFHKKQHVPKSLDDLVIAIIAGAVSPAQPRNAGRYAAQSAVKILHARRRN